MSSSKRPSKEKTPVRNTNTPIPSFDQPIFSPPYYHYGGMFPSFPQRPGQPHPQTPPLPQPDPDFNPFDFLSQPEFVQQTQTQPETVVSDSEPEFVTETQPTRATNKRKEKAEARCWERLEALVLAQSWIDISDDATVGKDQKHDRFWIRVLHSFHKGMGRGEYRSKHQVYSKWGKMNKEVMLFNDLWNNMKRQWKSGESDEVILQKALKVYQQENLKAFNKTFDQHIDSGSKRNRTSEFDHTTSDARVQFDLNEDEPVPVSPPSRPLGRDKSKNKGKGKASDSDDLKEMGTNMKDIKERMDKILKIASERELRKQRESDMRILAMDTSNMTGAELEVVLAMKEEVKNRYINRG
ncbi:uncharacterized protein LOC111883776 [Lactuca sativa]|uniref:uncharacterized protein LOC111883776 n=1 Tax=Lactuca sativa TaxID=4236 RepID=UPI0022AF952C|nr:uncharacterized protein LOC111883776 [Lactuca sativa]